MTTAPKTYKTEAIVLRHHPIGEADYLLTLFTPNRGKLRAVARGARRIKSKLGGHVEPPMRTSLFIAKGQNLDTVNQAEALEGFRPLREDLNRLSLALYMLEMVDGFSQEEQANYPVYRLVLDSLRSLSGEAPPALLPYFQLATARPQRLSAGASPMRGVRTRPGAGPSRLLAEPGRRPLRLVPSARREHPPNVPELHQGAAIPPEGEYDQRGEARAWAGHPCGVGEASKRADKARSG